MVLIKRVFSKQDRDFLPVTLGVYDNSDPIIGYWVWKSKQYIAIGLR